MMIVRSPFVKMIGEVMGEWVRSCVLKVNDDESMMGRGWGKRWIIEEEEVAIF